MVNPKLRLIKIRHSPILFVPILSEALYILEIFFYKLNIIQVVYLSRKTNKQKNILLNYISRTGPDIYLQTYKLGYIKEFSNLSLIADFVYDKNIVDAKLQNLHSLASSILMSNYVSKRTRKSLQNFIPKLYGRT